MLGARACQPRIRVGRVYFRGDNWDYQKNGSSRGLLLKVIGLAGAGRDGQGVWEKPELP